MDAVYGKIGGKVIPISYQYAEKTERLRLYARGSFLSLYPAYHKKSREADPQCRDVKFRKLRMRAYFADCGDIWKNRFINLTKSAHAALASKIFSGSTNTLSAAITNSAKTAA